MKTFLVTKDFTADFQKTIAKFRRDEVLVGIPETESARSGDEPINNATLLALNNFGSPANNIPARPVMEIGIKSVQDEIGNIFKEGAIEALSKGYRALSRTYNRAGIVASVAIKKSINDQIGIEPLAPSTLASRKSRGFKGTKALIVTGQMRNAITYVVKGED